MTRLLSYDRLLVLLLFLITICNIYASIIDQPGSVDNKADGINNNHKDAQITSEDLIKKHGIKKRFHILQMASNHSLIVEELQSRGWIKSKNGLGCSFKWGWSWEVLGSISKSMIINHFPNYQEIGSKKGLTDNMNNMLKNADLDTKSIIHSFFPRSYGLYNEDERESFIKDFDRTEDNNNNIKQFHFDDTAMFNDQNIMDTMVAKRSKDNNNNNDDDNLTNKGVNENRLWVKDSQPSIDGDNNIWIVKPSSQARGVGIQIFKDKKQLMDYVEKDNYEFIVQKYVEQPMTVHGRKFDIRQFVLVKSLNPLVIFLYDDCYLRFCSIEYTTNNLEDRFIHLSNHQVQKEFKGEHDDLFPHNQWPLSKFKSYLNEKNEDKDIKDVWEDKIYKKIVTLVKHTIDSWPKEGHRNNSFELLGFDILLNQQMEPLLLEVNTNPGLHLLTDTVNIHHPNAIKDLFKVIIDTEKQWQENPTFPKDLLQNNNKEELHKLFGGWNLIHVGDYDPSIKPMKFNDNRSNAGPFTVHR